MTNVNKSSSNIVHTSNNNNNNNEDQQQQQRVNESENGNNADCEAAVNERSGGAMSFVKVGQLGQGAYGTVWHVRHRITNEQYALKTIEVPTADEGIPQNVIREISTLKSVAAYDHPNIVKLVHVNHTVQDGKIKVNIFFEKCEWDLHDFLERIPQNMPDAQIRRMAGQMFNGIDFLHSHNIIHRDLKPQNILVTRDHRVKLADFGLARTYSLQASFTTVAVTLWYRAPELLLQCAYNTAVDMWSAGCILAEMYARRALFPGQTEAEQLRIIFEKLGTPPASGWPTDAILQHSFYQPQACIGADRLLPNVPVDGRMLIMNLLRFVPSRRFSAYEVLHLPYTLQGLPMVMMSNAIP